MISLVFRRPPAAAGIAFSVVLAAAIVLPGQAASAAVTRPAVGAARTAGAAQTAGAGPAADPASLVESLIGTTNDGDTFPGADMPFGMMQWSPDTPSRPDGGGYQYTDNSILGFSLTHLSGPGCRAEGDIPILPTVGKINTGATEAFSHAGESGSPGYYQVALGNKVTTKLTTTTRTGMAEFTFPKSAAANLIFKLDDSQRGDSAITFSVISKTEVQGSATTGNFCGATNSYTVHFDMQFSQPFTTSGTYKPSGLQRGARHLSVIQPGSRVVPVTVSPTVPEQAGHPVYHGPQPKSRPAVTPALTGPTGAYLTFNTTSGSPLIAKVGISYVSAANARANLTAENPAAPSTASFTTVQDAASSAWDALLGKIQVTGGTAAQQQVFYTALYHALLHPNVFSDDNGQYMGASKKVQTVDAGHSAFYTNFSGWDIYRTQAQLEALLDPAVASDTAQSMIDDYAQDGMLPKWAEDNGESYIMVGDPADPILADYYAFGATSFDTATALTDMVAQAAKANNIRPGLHYLNQPGYLPMNGSYGCCNYYGPVSSTLEYDTADFALSAFAGALGKTRDQQVFLNRSQDWRNVLNPASGFDQPRNANGTWTAGFNPAAAPTASAPGFVEADSWIYTGMVPFDVAGLAAAMGGDAAMNAYLGTVLRSYTGASGYAWVGDEPSIELPWEYDYTGEPYQTQETVRQVQDHIWTDTPGGLADGNDDLGAMSAWYVWSALGMYPMTPGTATLALGSPLFTQAVIALPSGNTLTINGNGAADDAPYVQSATWNGAAWNNAYAPAAAITAGGTLTYALGTTPDTAWAASPSEAPPSYPGNTIAPPDPRTGPVTSGVSAALCLNDKGSATVNLTPIQIVDCNGTDAQQWTVASDGTLRTLGMCLDVKDNGTASGTPVSLYTCNGTGAQRWTTGPGGSLVNPESHRCLDDPGSSATTGTQVQIYTCNSSAAQRWVLPAAPAGRGGAITSGASSATLCMDDRSGSTKNGNKVQVYTCNGTRTQKWYFDPDSTFRILGHCLNAAGSGVKSGTLVNLYACNGTAAQQWRATSAGEIINPGSGLCLDDPGPKGTQLTIATCTGVAAQTWTLPS